MKTWIQFFQDKLISLNTPIIERDNYPNDDSWIDFLASYISIFDYIIIIIFLLVIRVLFSIRLYLLFYIFIISIQITMLCFLLLQGKLYQDAELTKLINFIKSIIYNLLFPFGDKLKQNVFKIKANFHFKNITLAGGGGLIINTYAKPSFTLPNIDIDLVIDNPKFINHKPFIKNYLNKYLTHDFDKCEQILKAASLNEGYMAIFAVNSYLNKYKPYFNKEPMFKEKAFTSDYKIFSGNCYTELFKKAESSFGIKYKHPRIFNENLNSLDSSQSKILDPFSKGLFIYDTRQLKKGTELLDVANIKDNTTAKETILSIYNTEDSATRTDFYTYLKIIPEMEQVEFPYITYKLLKEKVSSTTLIEGVDVTRIYFTFFEHTLQIIHDRKIIPFMQLIQANKIPQSHHQICVILENTQNSDTAIETVLETQLNNLIITSKTSLTEKVNLTVKIFKDNLI